MGVAVCSLPLLCLDLDLVDDMLGKHRKVCAIGSYTICTMPSLGPCLPSKATSHSFPFVGEVRSNKV